jgi:hypothetical protein
VSAQPEFDPEAFHAGARSEREFLRQYVPQDDDEGVIANFERVREHQPFESQEKGTDMYRDVDYVRIRVRGNDKLEVHRRATEQDKRRFPFAWQQYQLGKEQSARGTPLDEIGIASSLLPAYHAKNVFTVEDLARVDDGNLQNLPAGSREFRHKARERVQLKQRAEGSDQLVEQNRQLIEQNAKLADQVSRLLARLEDSDDGGKQPGKKQPGKKQRSEDA